MKSLSAARLAAVSEMSSVNLKDKLGKDIPVPQLGNQCEERTRLQSVMRLIRRRMAEWDFILKCVTSDLEELK